MKRPFSQTLSNLAATLQHTLGEVAPDLSGLQDRLPAPLRGLLDRPDPAPTPHDDRFLAKTFAGNNGSRPYKLFVPQGYRGSPVPLIVMLHGCTQSPDDFAAGTRMNEVADTQSCLVAWPQQIQSANMQKCWNWFRIDDQQRDRGEPALIAELTRQIMRDYALDRRWVYLAGLSAGGAAAMVLGQTYPELFAAVGVHS